MKFQVLRGKHHEGGGNGFPVVTYRKGDIIDTQTDLLRMNGSTPKFALIDSNPSEVDYHDLTIPNLRKWATDRSIELGDAKRKADIIEIIEGVLEEEQEADEVLEEEFEII